MQVAEAFVSGSLGQAIFVADGALCVIDAPDADLRQALPNEIQLFRHAAREVAPAHPEGLPVTIEKVRSRLAEEVRFFNALDGLLIGMDRDFSEGLRRRSIARADQVLSMDGHLARRIRERFLVPASVNEWDSGGALTLAIALGAKAAVGCYRPLAAGIVDRVTDDIAGVVIEKHGIGLDGARIRNAVLRSGLVAELASIEAQADRRSLSMLVFRGDDFPKLRAVDPSRQLLTAIIRRVEQRIGAATSEGSNKRRPERPTKPVEDDAADEAADPIVIAVERAIDSHKRRRSRVVEGSSWDLPRIQREIDWIGTRLESGETGRAERAVIELIDRQGQRSRPEDILKTLTSVADLARRARCYDLTWRILAAIEPLGNQDAASMSVRAETLRDLGRHEEALAAFESTVRCFPQNEVAPNARAETLRDLGRHEEALAALEETMRRFPQNQFAPNARAEILRDLGRYEEALAAFEDIMRRFPQGPVAPTARAETLRNLGRHEDALAALKDIMRRFPQDPVAPNAHAETLRNLGRHEDALAAFEDTVLRFPQNPVAATARAEILRDLGRHEEALAALEDTVRRFPQNPVAPVARAETLRDLGRYEEAIAALEDTIRRFPQDQVAPNARAETLRDLGRHEEALAALEETMRRFPQNQVAPNARAETLRDLGRHEEALAALEETMRRFPQNQVAPTARAETLRDLGRYEEALATFEDTVRRFPQNQVAPNAYAHLLTGLGRLDQAEALLIPRATNPRTRSDWIAKHILAMAWLRAGRTREALSGFEEGARLCKLRDMQRNFRTGKTLALLADKRAREAAQELETLAKGRPSSRTEMTNIILFQMHALAEAGEAPRARALVAGAQVVDFGVARQKRLAIVLAERYGLVSGVPAPTAKAQQLNDEIKTLEFELVRPKLWTYREKSSDTRKVA